MLFYLDDSVVEAAETNTEVRDKLQELYYCWSHGLCIVSSSRKNFLRLKEIPGLESYIYIQKTVQGIQGIYATLSFFVILYHQQKKNNSLKSYSLISRDIEICAFTSMMEFAAYFLVCENVKDYEFYIWLTLQHNDFLKEHNFVLNTLPFNGGGDTIVDSINHIKRYFLLVVTDSDKKYINSSLGNTAAKVASHIESLGYQNVKTCWSYSMEAHEIENLIPLSLLKLVVGEKKIAIYEKINSTVFGDIFLKYFDFKEGFRESSYRSIKKNNYPQLSNYREMLLQIGKNDKSLAKSLHKVYNKNNDNEIVAGLGKTILGDTLTYLNTHNVSANAITIEKYQLNDWNEISRRVWSLGCAMSPQRV